MLDVKRAYRIARNHIYMASAIGKAMKANPGTKEMQLIRDIEIRHREKVVKVAMPGKWIGLPREVRKAVEWHYFEGYSAVKISYKSYVGVRTLYDWFDDFVRDVAVVAVAEKLIRLKMPRRISLRGSFLFESIFGCFDDCHALDWGKALNLILKGFLLFDGPDD